MIALHACLPKEDECYIDCYDPMDSFEISLFDEIDACGHDAPMNDTCKDDFATVLYDNHYRKQEFAVSHS